MFLAWCNISSKSIRSICNVRNENQCSRLTSCQIQQGKKSHSVTPSNCNQIDRLTFNETFEIIQEECESLMIITNNDSTGIEVIVVVREIL